MTISHAPLEIVELHRRLKRWLVEAAYPMWWTHGADRVRGGFHERLRFDATAMDVARRARLHPRQAGAFALAPALGWTGPSVEAVTHAIDFFLDHYRRDDGLYVRLVAPDGAVLDDGALLYDQAFALFGFAKAYASLRRQDCRDAGRALHLQLRSLLRHHAAGFYETADRPLPLLANSHMHLLEAALAWMEVDPEPQWADLAEELVRLALDRFLDPRIGFVREYFDDEWQPVASTRVADIEPGHQFEWGSLLLSWSRSAQDPKARRAALDLIERAERKCVDPARGVVFDGMNADGSVRDRTARLWPQTERLRAASAALDATHDARYWTVAVAAAQTLLRYLEAPTPGLWRDTMDVDGRFIDVSAPASSFYHLATAIAELDRALKE